MSNTARPSTSRIPEDGVSLSRIFTVLSHPYRRRILVLLLEHNPRDADDVTSEDVGDKMSDPDLVILKLFHTHLPKLEEAGFIIWDRSTDTITRGPRFDEIAPLLRLLDEHHDELPDDWP